SLRAVVEDQVDAIAAQLARPQRPRDLLADQEHARTVFRLYFRKERHVRPWHDQRVAAVDRHDVQERHYLLVLIDDATGLLTLDDATKRAGNRGHAGHRTFGAGF